MRTETRTAPPTFPGGDPISYRVEVGGVDITPHVRPGSIELRSTGSISTLRTLGPGGWAQDGPRTLARRRAYAKRRALLGGDDGRNATVDACRVLTGIAMVRRANLDRKRGVRR